MALQKISNEYSYKKSQFSFQNSSRNLSMLQTKRPRRHINVCWTQCSSCTSLKFATNYPAPRASSTPTHLPSICSADGRGTAQNWAVGVMHTRLKGQLGAKWTSEVGRFVELQGEEPEDFELVPKRDPATCGLASEVRVERDNQATTPPRNDSTLRTRAKASQ